MISGQTVRYTNVPPASVRFDSPDSDRWALATQRDAPSSAPPSYVVELSDGTVFGGELAEPFVHRRIVEYIAGGAA